MCYNGGGMMTKDWEAAHHRYLVRYYQAPDGERPTAENTIEQLAMLNTRTRRLEPLRLPGAKLYPHSHPDYPYNKHGREY